MPCDNPECRRAIENLRSENEALRRQLTGPVCEHPGCANTAVGKCEVRFNGPPKSFAEMEETRKRNCEEAGVPFHPSGSFLASATVLLGSHPHHFRACKTLFCSKHSLDKDAFGMGTCWRESHAGLDIGQPA